MMLTGIRMAQMKTGGADARDPVAPSPPFSYRCYCALPPSACSASRLSPLDFTLFRLSALRSDSLRLRGQFLATSRDEAG